ncbi:DegT/DnrJ/EryC1/StrS family aminotransferase [Cellulomonas sp.]|uniref:DegT/DnrJ/EryC1/StrS family aminotransferase n=1 Tax=Cellulomonas sp. TaxID=40001 RepID=UPI002D2F41D4|nr:DegT/DnrJ/EryC1/StrS family aminotransferase [Cellulomonas sp.]HYQ74700.1 DegT/DnrJ/EryC1/StrS family aminotransferase [Cellulomonas sp.]
MIPISSVDLGPEVEAEVLKVLRSGMVAQGPVVAEFERRFAELSGVKHAVAVNNGTTALVASLQVLDLEPGDEVITSPFTFVATLNAILEAGATATFADIDDADFNLSAAATAAAVTDRTKVLMPVHLYGQTADAPAFAALAAERGLALVEDSAQAHGATFEGRAAGSFGIGCFSFYGTKNLTTGEGGIITTDDDTVADRLRVLRNQGMRARYQYEVAGHNYRLTDLQAALALPQLDRYDKTVATRKANAARLAEGLADVPGLVVPRELPGRSHVWHQFTVRVTQDAAVSRDELVAKLTEAGVGSGIYYPKLVFDYPTYLEHPRVRISDVPVAARVVTEVLSLPVHPKLSEGDLDTVVSTVRRILGA